MIYDGSLEGLRASAVQVKQLVVDLDSAVDVQSLPKYATVEKQEQSRVWIRYDAQKLPTPELVKDITGRYPVRDLTIKEQDIEGVIRDIYQGGIVGLRGE